MLAQSAAHDDTDDVVASDSSSDAAAAQQAPQQRNLLLSIAAMGGDLATLNRLLDEGADPNYLSDGGFCALFFAVSKNHVDCVARLLEVGANPNHYANTISADVIPKIVDYWAHLGWYEYSVPGTGSRVVATGPEESSSSQLR